MALLFHLGKFVLIAGLVLQGLYFLGVFPNEPLLKSMAKGGDTLLTVLRVPFEIANPIKQNIPLIAKSAGALITLALFNLLFTSRAILKLIIIGEFIITLFIGVPWRIIQGKGTILDTNDKSLFHLGVNVAIIGGLIYWHSVSKPAKVEAGKEKTE